MLQNLHILDEVKGRENSENAISDNLETSNFQNLSAGCQPCDHSQMFCLYFCATAIYDGKVPRTKIILSSLA
jgi:hypothetical protein